VESRIAVLIREAVQVYAAAGLNCGHELLPPASDADIDAIALATKQPVPEMLRALYRTHGGQGYLSNGTRGLFGRHALFSPAEAIADHRLLMSFGANEPSVEPLEKHGFWQPQLLPFAGWDAYHLCVHSTTGVVWEFVPDGGLRDNWSNIMSVLEELIATVRQGDTEFL
jgi:hypothetical protein